MSGPSPISGNQDNGNNNQNAEDPNTDGVGSEVEETPLNILTLRENIDEILDSNQINWSGINWRYTDPISGEFSSYIVSGEHEQVLVLVDNGNAPRKAFTRLEVERVYDRATRELSENQDLEAVDEKTQYVVKELSTDLVGEVADISGSSDLFVVLVGTGYNDHMRNESFYFPEGETSRDITGAMFGMAGDDVFYTAGHIGYTPLLAGGTGNDSYVFDSGTSAEILEYGNDAEDTFIFNTTDLAYSGTLEGRHLILANSGQSDLIIFWNYLAPDAKIENFWVDWDNNGINEHYTFEEFLADVEERTTDFGDLQSQEVGISAPTWDELTTSVGEAINASLRHEDFRSADLITVEDIGRLYQAAFDRKPDMGGLNFWVDEWEEQLLSVNEIADFFVFSEEFINAYGADSSDEEFVSTLYNNVLGRTPDATGLAYWTESLAEGMTRADVLYSFAESPENRANTEYIFYGQIDEAQGEWDIVSDTRYREATRETVEDIARLYAAGFDRNPDTEGLNFWVDQWENEFVSLTEMAANIIASDEFMTMYGSDQTDTEFLTTLYDNVFDRAPDDAGLGYWLYQLSDEGGASREDVLYAFSDSPENHGNTELLLLGLSETSPGTWDFA